MKKKICTPEETKQLKELCRGGRLYEVEAWIRQGKPVNAPPTERKSPLLIAVEKGFYSLVELLLRNGAKPNANGKVLEAAAYHSKDTFRYRPFPGGNKDGSRTRSEVRTDRCRDNTFDTLGILCDRRL